MSNLTQQFIQVVHCVKQSWWSLLLVLVESRLGEVAFV
uniref:Uncharacterized protein n=1 Tax=Rhizophora mucronata TaxID=61149 RepID=A0A2P2QHQ3_RHIMU